VSDDASAPVVPALAPTYRERLWVPWWGWLLVVALAAMLGIAYGYAIHAWIGWLMFAVVTGVGGWGLLVLAVRVVVDETGLRVGRVVLEGEHLGDVLALDRQAAVRLRGRDADARAFVVLRAWVKTAIRLDVADDRDPTPYWFVSTRHPARLAAAITDAARWSAGRPSATAANAEEEPR
jgi:hypothetical protein